MTQEEFDKAPLLDQILYDETGMLAKNHPSIAEAMEKYHQAKLKLLGIADFIEEIEYMQGLYSNARYTQAEATRDKLAEQLDDLMRLGQQ